MVLGEEERLGVRYMSQLCAGNVLKSFMNLQGEFALPKSPFYRYLQLRHALNSQTCLSRLTLKDHSTVIDSERCPTSNRQERHGLAGQFNLTQLSTECFHIAMWEGMGEGCE